MAVFAWGTSHGPLHGPHFTDTILSVQLTVWLHLGTVATGSMLRDVCVYPTLPVTPVVVMSFASTCSYVLWVRVAAAHGAVRLVCTACTAGGQYTGGSCNTVVEEPMAGATTFFGGGVKGW
jgi:hypothetical protein